MKNTNTKSRRKKLRLPPALYYPDYRNFWLGLFGAVGGFQILMFAQFWLVHVLTGSALYLGYIGAANAIPAIILNLFGGVVADRVNKQKLIIITESLNATSVFLLGMLTATGVVRAWHVLVIAIFSGAVNAFNQPARQALYPYLIDRKDLMSAVALNSAVWTGTRIIAPALAGAIIALLGNAAPFFVSCAGISIFAFVISRLDVPAMETKSNTRSSKDLAEGLKYIKENSIFSFLILMTFFNSFFGMGYVAQMPVFARDILDVGAEGQGFLMSVSGVGSLIVTLYLGMKTNLKHKGLILIFGAAFSGLSVAAFALTSGYIASFPLALLFMVCIGVFSSVFLISVMNSLQMLVPNRLRGRVMGFYGMTWNIMPLGGLYAGALAHWTGVPWAIAIGGFLVTAFALGPAMANRNVRNLGELLEKTGKK